MYPLSLKKLVTMGAAVLSKIFVFANQIMWCDVRTLNLAHFFLLNFISFYFAFST